MDCLVALCQTGCWEGAVIPETVLMPGSSWLKLQSQTPKEFAGDAHSPVQSLVYLPKMYSEMERGEPMSMSNAQN